VSRIYIVGCAKTRTTLFHRLFAAFDGVMVVPGECEIGAFQLFAGQAGATVIKRGPNALFSSIMPTWKQLRELYRIHRNELSVIYLTRNRADTLKSYNNYVQPERYDACQQQAKRWRRYIDMTVDTDRMMESADALNACQREVAERFKLAIRDRWSDYPAFIPPWLYYGDNTRVRPIEYRGAP
jgi:hypothetical protein